MIRGRLATLVAALALLAGLLAGCGGSSQKDLTVSAAASLRGAFTEYA
jgi:ABC-type molybdate transport system substrate-binding protein